MPKNDKKMLKSMVIQNALVSTSHSFCEFLYANKASAELGRRVSMHTHPFWQMEFAIDNAFVASVGKDQYRLSLGDILVIPPGAVHGFSYESGTCTIASFKYKFHSVHAPGNACRVPESQLKNVLQGSLLRLVPSSGKLRPTQALILSHLLAGIMDLCVQTGSGLGVRAMHTLGDRVKEYIIEHVREPLTVQRIAQDLGFSVGHVSSQFKKGEGVSLKSYLDMQRAELARRQLMYSDLSVGQIAERLGFPDPYTFSHFCRRMLGQSPREIRQEMKC